MNFKLFVFCLLFCQISFAQQDFSFPKKELDSLLTHYEKNYLGTNDSSKAKFPTLRLLVQAHRNLRNFAKNMDSTQVAVFMKENNELDKRCKQILKKEELHTFLNKKYKITCALGKYLATNWKDTSYIYRLIVPNAPVLFQTLGKRFKNIDSRACKTFAPTSVQHLANYLSKPYSDELSKVRSIYMWVSTKISYDHAVLKNRSLYAENNIDVIRRRKGICENFATLFQELCQKSGIEVQKIHGYAKGVGYKKGEYYEGKTNHAWNKVKIDGNWYLIETTWASGSQGYEFYFLADPYILIGSHYPEHREDQLLENSMEAIQFEELEMTYPSRSNAYSSYAVKIAKVHKQKIEREIEEFRQKLSKIQPKTVSKTLARR
ncbi:MAG: hypothetical protein EAZ97_15075 [Bacteroidetes bacterium]|nr:MAG: hypothetical protein EAZ97_15075 [Bacteroidota bacterium]